MDYREMNMLESLMAQVIRQLEGINIELKLMRHKFERDELVSNDRRKVSEEED